MAAFDTDAISATLIAGAYAIANISATEVVKETTKSAFNGLKAKIAEIWGRNGERAVEKVEADPSSQEALDHLKAVIAVVAPEDEPDVLAKHEALLAALSEDDVAKRAAEQVATIKLDIQSGGAVRIRSLRNARRLDIKSVSASDFELGHVDMDPGKPRGN